MALEPVCLALPVLQPTDMKSAALVVSWLKLGRILGLVMAQSTELREAVGKKNACSGGSNGPGPPAESAAAPNHVSLPQAASSEHSNISQDQRTLTGGGGRAG